MNDLDDFLNAHWRELKRYKNVFSLRVSTKFVKGKDTGNPCLAFFVPKKLSVTELEEDERVPPFIEGIQTDVVEFDPKKWRIGKTSMSELSPETQKRKASGVIRTCK